MRLLVTGDRNWDNISVVVQALSQYSNDSILIHGNCKGADLTAAVVAEEFGFEIISCPAHWRHNTKDWIAIYGECDTPCNLVVGKAAGVLRNGFMLDEHQPDRVLAFHNDLIHSVGTLDMIKRARTAGIQVDLFNYEGFVGVNPPISKIALKEFLKSSKSELPSERFFVF